MSNLNSNWLPFRAIGIPIAYRLVMMFTVGWLATGWIAVGSPIANLLSAQESATANSQAKKAGATTNNQKALPDSWWFFRGDAKATGFVPDSKLPEKLEVVWEFESDRSAFEGSPVVATGRVIAADLDGHLWCLDLATGKKTWSIETETSYIASPTLRGDHIFLGDADGIFHCYSAKDGKEIWKYESFAQIDSSANFYDGNVLFGSQDATLYCLDAKTGQEQWKHATDDQIRCSIVVAGDLTYVAGCDGRLHIVNLKDGMGTGEVGLTSVTGSTPANSGDHVFFGLEDGLFLCADVAKKEIVWEWSDPKKEAAIRGSAAITKEVAVFGTRGSQVVCLNLKDGKEIWKQKVDRKVDGSPVIVGSKVYVGDGAGKLLTMDLKSGETLQEIELIGSVLGSPAVVGDKLIVATDEGMVYCLGKK